MSGLLSTQPKVDSHLDDLFKNSVNMPEKCLRWIHMLTIIMFFVGW